MRWQTSIFQELLSISVVFSLFALLLKKHKKILERLQINNSVQKENHIIPEHVLNGGSDHEQVN